MEVIKDKVLDKFLALISREINKNAIVLSETNEQALEQHISEAVLNIWLHGYSKGFKDRDRLDDRLKIID